MLQSTITITEPKLLRLMTWLSPGFPVGAFAFSHGLEHAVEMGEVGNKNDLVKWIDGLLRFGSGRIDTMFFRIAYEAMQEGDDSKLDKVNARAQTQRSSAELALESTGQGQAFLETAVNVWPYKPLEDWCQRLEEKSCQPAYAVAVGAICGVAVIPLPLSLTAYLHAFTANLVSAALRLAPIGQTDGQRAMAALERSIIDAVSGVLSSEADDLGSASLCADWHSVQHEAQYTRLFRS